MAFDQTYSRQRLQHALDRIEQEPDRHDQEVWIAGTPDKDGVLDTTLDCKTACCLAGDIVLATGQWVPVTGDLTSSIFSRVVHKDDLAQWRKRPETVHTEQVPALARRIARLTAYEAVELFSGTNTIEDLWVIAHRIDNGIRMPERITKHLPEWPAPIRPTYTTEELETAAAYAITERVYGKQILTHQQAREAAGYTTTEETAR